MFDANEDTFLIPEGATLRSNDDGTVTLIMPSGGEHTYDPDIVFRANETDPFTNF